MSEWEPWIGVDLDGTLASTDHSAMDRRFLIGAPIPLMVERVKRWVAKGKTVKIFTARMCTNEELWQKRIGDWTECYIGTRLEATCRKDYGMIELWDDRAVPVICDTGEVGFGTV